MKIDFRKIEASDIEGNKSTYDLSKELGNAIYRHTPDLGELDFAQDIYRNGEVEVDSHKAGIVRTYMEKGQFLAFIKKSVYEILDSINQ